MIEHPIILEALSTAREKRSNQIEFRKSVFRIGRLMAYEFIKTMQVEKYELETPLGKSVGYRVPGRDKIVIVLVLRAAIPLVEGLYKMFPQARTGIVSAWRGPPPDFAVEINYVKIPQIDPEDTVLIADPMLATGNTLVAVAERVLRRGTPKRLVFMTVLSCREGIQKVVKAFPDAEIYTCAIDPRLNRKGYIVPGLGDAGDRCFGSSEKHEIS